MRVGSLFSGIGGLDLGLEWAGMTVTWQSETNLYCSGILTKQWPGVPNLGDVTKIVWEDVERVDLVCGGFPCQPFSHAGIQLGADDPRYLWPEVVRCLRVLRPRLALLENVPGLLARGGEFGRVLGDLADLGYDAEWDCIPAAAIGAPHLRYRVFVVAHTDEYCEPGVPIDAGPGRRVMVPVADTPGDGGSDEPWGVDGTALVSTLTGPSSGTGRGDPPPGVRVDGRAEPGGPVVLADTDRERRDRWTGIFGPGWWGQPPDGSVPMGDTDITGLEGLGAEHGLRTATGTGDPRGAGWWAAEPDVGRVAHGVPHRMDRLKSLGNAVVPQVAEAIGRRIMERV